MDADELDWNRTLREQWEFHLSAVRLLLGLYPRAKPATNGATR